MTEEEAKTKICPMIPGEADWDARQVRPAHCIASQCMAWRWRATLVPKDADKPFTGPYVVKREQGFCGLAGKVE
jgi:hypothetical protein